MLKALGKAIIYIIKKKTQENPRYWLLKERNIYMADIVVIFIEGMILVIGIIQIHGRHDTGYLYDAKRNTICIIETYTRAMCFY